MDAYIGTICFSGEGAQGGKCPVPPRLLLLYSYIGLLRNSIVQILRNTKFWQNLFEFHEISWNSKKILWNTKLIISQKFCKIMKNKFFCSHLAPTQSAVCCTNSHLLKQSFAMWQCFFEMKPIYTYTVVFHSVIFNSVPKSLCLQQCGRVQFKADHCLSWDGLKEQSFVPLKSTKTVCHLNKLLVITQIYRVNIYWCIWPICPEGSVHLPTITKYSMNSQKPPGKRPATPRKEYPRY